MALIALGYWFTSPSGPLSTRRRGGEKHRTSPLSVAWRGDLGMR
jgi:hypothetical protein